MDPPPEKKFSELVGLVRSWLPWRSEPSNVSRDFWMPDHICRVCYECDAQFTIFNRKHHCRLCGRVFCGKCTSNWIPALPSDARSSCEDWERIRVCNYCFKQWEKGIVSFNNGIQVSSLGLIPSPSAASFTSTRSTVTMNSTTTSLASASYASASCQRTQQGSGVMMDADIDEQAVATSEKSEDISVYSAEPSPNQYRSDDDDDYYYDLYHFDSDTRYVPQENAYYGHTNTDTVSNGDESHNTCIDGDNAEGNISESSTPLNSLDMQNVEQIQALDRKEDEHDTGDECETSTSMYAAQDVEAEPVDFENNGLLWLPPEPEDEEDERENDLLDDDDEGDGMGEWGSLRSLGSFGSGEYRNRERSIEEHKNVIKNVVDGHFRALVAQLLQVGNLPIGEEGDKNGWLEIIISLSWEAATLLKPDMSKSGGMDPGGYVKVKCLASGWPYESMVVKGVVCKKNVAHRRMKSTIEKARLLILGGALEYQRVTNHLSSFDTLLQQEIDHLKMAVAKIDAHHPNVLLVEKSVSRYAQEYLLGKNISLVLNIKRPLLERIARCTGAQIVPSVDHLSSPMLGYCDTFHVDRILEEHGSAGQGGKKLVKTLMFFEDCPKPLGCTIILRGANEDELKKVKHVVQYGVFAAYHLALETSFLADEGASLPELPMTSPITVALPDKASSIVRSISTIPGFGLSADEKPQGSQHSSEPLRSLSVPSSVLTSSINSDLVQVKEVASLPSITSSADSQPEQPREILPDSKASISSDHLGQTADSYHVDGIVSNKYKEKKEMVSKLSLEVNFSSPSNQFFSGCRPLEAVAENFSMATTSDNVSIAISQQLHNSDGALLSQGSKDHSEETGFLKEEFPPSPADHQSILVSLSSRCVWKGTVCERSHLFRIKYYGNFDKPLGRFLQDHLFDQNFRCRSCDMPSEAHVRCYTHRQGTLTISVKRLPEFLLPGEKEGKIWMWHRCLHCPRTNGFPPATRRVVMSDAAWGLSFGKFLELSFSNHAAASRVASCGHSLHRDCLRFYGFGKMVACFRYASINVHSVCLPPATLDFNSDNQDYIRKETEEVVNRAELLFSEVLNALGQISEKRSSMKTPESRRVIADLEEMLQKEKAEFEESLQKTMNRGAKNGQPAVDILHINRLRRQLVFQSYMWDHRLIHVASVDNNSFQDGFSASEDRSLFTDSKPAEINIPVNPSDGFNNRETSIKDVGMNKCLSQDQKPASVDHSDALHRQVDLNLDINCGNESQVPSDQTSPLESCSSMGRALSEGQTPLVTNLSDTLDAAWTGEHQSGTLLPTSSLNDSSKENCSNAVVRVEGLNLENHAESKGGLKRTQSVSPKLPIKGSDNIEDYVGWLKMPFYNFYWSLNKNFLGSSQKFDELGEYRPVYISPFLDTELQAGGGRLLLPVGINDTVLPVFDDEPTSIISYALMSPQYHAQVCDEGERPKDSSEVIAPFMASDPMNSRSFHSSDDLISDPYKSVSSVEDSHLSMSGSRTSVTDSLSYTKALHARVNFTDDSPQDKVKYSVTCYYAKRFEALRKISCPSELDYVRSLSRCKKWGAQGGKSGVFFAKTLDDRFIIKQVTKTELESFIKFGPEYFKYLSESIRTCSPTCLAKILGIYQVTAKHVKGGKETKIDVLIMENLLFKRTVTRLYDLKGSSRSRYNPDASGSNKVLLDQNLIEQMPTSPIFVGNKAKRLLDRAVWNDTSFLASVDVMDYSLLLGVDQEKHELVLGIIDFMRQYTWDKHLETWVKASGILGGPKNASPTVISPMQYKKRFRKAMTTYFLMLPDQWSPLIILPSRTPPDSCEENAQGGSSAE